MRDDGTCRCAITRPNTNRPTCASSATVCASGTTCSTRIDVDVDDFPNRAFLRRVLGRLTLPAPRDTEVLEYGCGTAPAARFLAARGFQVDAVDLIPRAIAIARKLAAARGLTITFGVEDVCDWTTGPTEPTVKQYDLVVDSYCLQSVVLTRTARRCWPAYEHDSDRVATICCRPRCMTRIAATTADTCTTHLPGSVTKSRPRTTTPPASCSSTAADISPIAATCGRPHSATSSTTRGCE